MKQICRRPTGRCYPINYPNGAGIGNVSAVTIDSIGINRNTLTLTGLAGAYLLMSVAPLENVWSPGDRSTAIFIGEPFSWNDAEVP